MTEHCFYSTRFFVDQIDIETQEICECKKCFYPDSKIMACMWAGYGRIVVSYKTERYHELNFRATDSINKFMNTYYKKGITI
jgi:hypothetical protein